MNFNKSELIQILHALQIFRDIQKGLTVSALEHVQVATSMALVTVLINRIEAEIESRDES